MRGPLRLSPLWSAVLALVLTACATPIETTRPALQLPASWSEAAPGSQGDRALERDWWRAFGSPELESLVAEAQAASPDLAIAAERVRQAELAARLEPAFGWDQLVLPERSTEVLHSISAYLRHRDLVLSEWGYGRTVARTQGLKDKVAADHDPARGDPKRDFTLAIVAAAAAAVAWIAALITS